MNMDATHQELHERFLACSGAHVATPPLWPAAMALSALLQRGDVWERTEEALVYLDALAGDRLAARPNATEAARAQIIVELLAEQGFTGNTERYEDPANSFVDRVLERRSGLPITLGVIALRIAEQAGVPLVGVAFPGHFMVATDVDAAEPAVFDPFNGGRRLSFADLAALYRAATGKAITSQAPLLRQSLQPANSRSILTRILRNLQHHYALRGAHDRSAEVVDLLAALHPDQAQLRDLQGKLHRRVEELN